MLIEIGHVEAIFRYPVKSMGGERLEVAKLGWHGLDGDRRLAFRRIDDRSGLPWLTASKLPYHFTYNWTFYYRNPAFEPTVTASINHISIRGVDGKIIPMEGYLGTHRTSPPQAQQQP